VRNKRGLGMVMCLGVCLAITVSPMAKADSPSLITVRTVNGAVVDPELSATLSYGSALELFGTASSGDRVTFTATGPCFVTNVHSGDGQPRHVLIKATSTQGLCVVTAAARNAEDGTNAEQVLTFATQMGNQSAKFTRSGGKVRRGASVILAPRDLRTMQGRAVNYQLVSGQQRCVLARKKSNRVLIANRTGSCAIRVTAPGIPGRYLPYSQTLSFIVRN